MSASNLNPMSLEASSVEKVLRDLERELEVGSVARPPSEDALNRWQMQAEELQEALKAAILPSRNRLLRAAGRFLDDLKDMRERKARYLAHRQAERVGPEHSLDALALGDCPGTGPRRALADSIRDGLKVLTGATAPQIASEDSAIDRSAAEPALASSDDSVKREDGLDATSVDTPTVSADLPLETVPVVTPDDRPNAGTVVERLHGHGEGAAKASLDSNFDVRNTVVRTSGTERTTQSGRLSRRVDPIMAVVGRLARPDSFAAARDIALGWLRKKGFNLPADPTEAFEVQARNNNTATSVCLLDRGVWALQAETSDAGVHGRRWRVEMVLLDVAPTPAVSVTLTALSPSDAPEPPTSVPQLVTMLANGVGLLDADDASSLDAGPILVDGQEALHRLLAAIRSPSRTRPVLVLPTYRKDDQEKQLLDPVGVSRKLGSLARVFVLQRGIAWAFNEAVGPRAAVAGASVRLYLPGFSDDDPSGQHPFWSPNELNAQGLTLHSLSDRLLREAAYISLRATEREEGIPPFERVRNMVLRRQIEEARRKIELAAMQRTEEGDVSALQQQLASEAELRKLFEEENAKLEGHLARVRSERNSLKTEQVNSRGRILHLEGRIRELLQKLRDSRGHVEPTFPDNWDELEQWCEEHLAGRLVLTSKALHHARRSRFLDVSFAYRVLWFLAEHYVPARCDGGEDFKTGLGEMGLEVSPVGRSALERSSKDTYSTDYKGERVALDWHVKGSNSRDPRYGFRIYFHWDAKERCMVIGSLPEHLDNHLS